MFRVFPPNGPAKFMGRLAAAIECKPRGWSPLDAADALANGSDGQDCRHIGFHWAAPKGRTIVEVTEVAFVGLQRPRGTEPAGMAPNLLELRPALAFRLWSDLSPEEHGASAGNFFRGVEPTDSACLRD